MKQSNLETVGGRIRQARTEAAMNIKKLAELVNVTPTYLGIVERGERNPSAVLLQKIAQVTGSTLEWLQTGKKDKTENKADIQKPNALSQNFQGPVPTNIDVPLFLSLVLQSVPNMSREKLASMLDVSREDMDGVLSGRAEPDARWAGYFPVWAEQMDASAVCQKLRDIDLFVQHYNMEKKRKRLYESLKRYAGPEYQYFIPPSRQRSKGNLLFDDGLHSERIIFQKGEVPGLEDRHFIFYEYDGDIEDFPVDAIIYKQDNDKNNEISYGKLTHIFTDERIIEKIQKKYNKKQVENEGTLVLDSSSNVLPDVFLLLADSDTWEIKEDWGDELSDSDDGNDIDIDDSISGLI